METWNSFLQTVFQFVKSLFVAVSKKMHRNAVVLTTGVAVVTVVTFTAGDFHGGGKNAMVAFAETPQATDETETELEETRTAAELVTEPTVTEAINQETASESQESETEESGTQASEEPAASENAAAEEAAETNGSKEAAEKTAAAGPGYGTPDDNAESTQADSAIKEDAGAAAHSGLKEVETSENTEIKPEEAAEVFACSNSDYRVLLKIVQAEAGICDTKGRILVANVILNRVKSDQFPDSIPGVVYEKYQFSPVIDGSIDTCKVTQKTIDAVDRALAGEDYSQGALYFMNRRTSAKKNVRWFDSRLEYLFKHENHEFFK